MRLKACILTVLVVLGAAAAFGANPAILGTWLGKTEVPDQGIDDLVLVFTKTETGLAGTVSDTLGLIEKETKIAEIKVAGDKIVTLQFPLVDGSIIVCSLTYDKDKMTGTWSHPEGDIGKLEFVRKK
jgi:hypothetical protein